jgi:peptidoglycan/LPS O-acetylase OafA/YrhL
MQRHAPRLAYMPGLDGIRALAVLAVMAYHGGLSFLPAGFFGVDAFFVLSGFLITTLLVTESASAGRIAVRAFWGRRARRLLPALLLMLVFVVLYARFVAPSGAYPGLRWDALASLFYSANWRFIANGQSYTATAGPVTPLLHMWSLAIEEQFYIVWPLLLLVVMRLRRGDPTRALRTLLAVSVGGALASALEMGLVFGSGSDPTRAYFGTDTHAQCLLVGTALAAGLALWRRRQPVADLSRAGRRAVSAGGVAGVGVCAWAWSQLQYDQAFVFRGGFLLVSVSVAAVIASVVLEPAGLLARGLALPPLRFLGRISYGMYLWHFPLDIALSAARTGTEGATLFLLRAGATVAVSTLSFYVVERPLRAGAVAAAIKARVVAPAAVVATAALVVAATVPAAASGAPLPSPGTAVRAAAAGAGPAAPVRVLLVGDSVALSLGVGLTYQATRSHITLEDLGILGCGVAFGTVLWADDAGQEQPFTIAPPCQSGAGAGVPWTDAWRSWLGEVHPNVVVLLAGRWEVTDHLYDGVRTDILHAGFAAYVRGMLERAVAIGTSTGAHMVLMTAPCFSEGEQPDGSPFPEDDIRRVEAYNRLVDEVGAANPSKVTVQDLFSMACPGRRFTTTLHGAPFRSADGVHFDTAPGTGADLLAPRILPEWENLGHAQQAAGGSVVTTPLPTTFSPP